MAMLEPTIEVTQFGKLPDGQVVLKYILKNRHGTELEVLDYGGTVRRFVLNGPDNQPRNVIVGPDTLEGMLENAYYGALIGRVGNRIAAGRFELDGKCYTLATNNAPGGIPCALHGGEEGFNARVWKASHAIKEDGTLVLRLTLSSPDGDQGYPGQVDVEVVYELTDDNTWRITYNATTTAATPINLTQHAYWNLEGCAKGDICEHTVMVAASSYTPVNAGLIPTGEIATVKGTPFDFTQPRLLGTFIDAENDQIQYGAGYDHNFVLDHSAGELAFAALVKGKDGMAMEIWTDQPGMQIYTGNYIPEGMMTPNGPTVRRGGVAFETQHFADSVNQPEFPSVILRPGETFHSVTEYRFPFA